MNPLFLSALIFFVIFLTGIYFFERQNGRDRQIKIEGALHFYREKKAVSHIREELQVRKAIRIFFGFVILFCLQNLIGLGKTVILVGLVGLYLLYKKMREKQKFEEEILVFLPQALDALARSLKSGLSLFQALEIVRYQNFGVISKEFGFILDSMKLGITFKEALQKSAERIPVKAYQFLTLSLLIQQETGGSLFDLLYGLRDALRQKQFLAQKVRALSAQSRTSALVLAALPFLSFIAAYFMNREYVMVFIDDPRGQIMGLTALGLLATGLFIIRRMVKAYA